MLPRGEWFHTWGPVASWRKSLVDKGLETTRRGHLAKLGSRLGCGRGEACLQGGVSSSAMWTREDPVQHALPLGKFGVHTGPPRGWGSRIWTCQTWDPWGILKALSPGTCKEAPGLSFSGSRVPHSPRGGTWPHLSLTREAPQSHAKAPRCWPAPWDPTAEQPEQGESTLTWPTGGTEEGPTPCLGSLLASTQSWAPV